MAQSTVVPYQFSVRTNRDPADLLEELSTRGVGGIGVAERGPSYLVLRPTSKNRYGTDVAIALGFGILIVTLLLTAVNPVLIILLPLALAPAIPLWRDHRPMLAVSAVVDEDGAATRVTVHGQAGPELAAALDAYLGALPATPVLEPAESTG